MSSASLSVGEVSCAREVGGGVGRNTSVGSGESGLVASCSTAVALWESWAPTRAQVRRKISQAWA